MADLLTQFSPDDILKKYGEGAAVAYFFLWIILFSVVLVLLFMAMSRSAHRRRKLRRIAWGKRYGLETGTLEMGKKLFGHSETEVGQAVLRDYPYVKLFQEKMAMGMHILEGEVDGLKTRVFEYRYITGSGRTTVEHKYSVVAFEYPAVKGYTGMRRHSRRDGLAKDDLQTGNRAFDDEFYIYADEWGLMAKELPQDVAQAMLDCGMTDLVMAEKRLAIVTRVLKKDAAYDRFFADARKLGAYFASKT